MYSLQVPPSNKVFKYNSHTDTLSVNRKDILTFTNEQCALHLLNLAAKRSKASKRERPLYTAFMIRLAQRYPSYTAAFMSMQSVYSKREWRQEVYNLLDDVLQKKIKVRGYTRCFC